MELQLHQLFIRFKFRANVCWSNEPELGYRTCVEPLTSTASRYRWIRKIMALARAVICLKTLPFQQRYFLTHSHNIVFLYSPGHINVLITCPTLITLITLNTESFISSPKLTLALAALNWHPPLQSLRWVLRESPRTWSRNENWPRSPPRRILQSQISVKTHYLSTNLFARKISRIL